MIKQLIPLIPCAVTFLTVAIAPKAQAASFTIPTPIVTEIVPSDAKTDFIDGGTSAKFINDVVVEQPEGIFSTVFNVCFEYGSYNDIFTATRPASCLMGIPELPTFLGDQTRAQRSADGPTPTNMPTSDGILTAVTNAFGGDQMNGVIRFRGDVIFEGANSGPIDTLEAYVPYAVDTDTVSAIKVVYNDIDQLWELDGIDTPISFLKAGDLNTGEGYVMFARFEDTGEEIRVEVPEPSSVVGLFLTGIFMLSRRRR